MVIYVFLVILVMTISIWQVLVAFLATNTKIMTGEVTYICAFIRQKDLSIDDMRMPEILTFCACTIIHESWVLTSRQCYVQLDWFVSPITKQFQTSKLPENLHKIVTILDKREMSLVRVSPELKTGRIEFAQNILTAPTTCELYGFSSPNNQPVNGDIDGLIYKVWLMEGDLLQTKINALNFTECWKKHNFLSSSKQNVSYSTLCINPLMDEYLEPCSFDRGAPIICNGKLQGILVYNRPVPEKFPWYLPSGCYGLINNNISIYAEGLTPQYFDWIIENLYKQQISK